MKRSLALYRLALCIALILVSACSPSRSSAFGPVSQLTLERTGFEVKWRARALDDPRYAEQVRALLEKPLTIESAVKIALVNNRDLQAAFESIGLGIAAVAGATLQNPEFDAELRFPIDGDGTAVTLTAIQDLVSALTLPGRRRAAQAELNARRYRALAEIIDLTSEVKLAFYQLQAAQQIAELQATAMASQQAQLELSQRLRDAGNTTELATAREAARLAELKVKLSVAELETMAAREELNEKLGLSGGATAWVVESRLTMLTEAAMLKNLPELESQAVDKSIALERQRWRIRAAAAHLGVARIEAVIPRLGVGVAAEREFGGEWSVGPVVSVALPLWDRNKSGRARYNAELRMAQHRYAAIAIKERALARLLQVAHASVLLRAQFVQNELLPMRQRVVRETLKHYNAMNATPFELLSARRAELGAALELIEALHMFWRIQTRVEQAAMGGTASIGMSEAAGEMGATRMDENRSEETE